MSATMTLSVTIVDDASGKVLWERTVSQPREHSDRGAQAQNLAVEAAVENGVGGAQVTP